MCETKKLCSGTLIISRAVYHKNPHIHFIIKFHSTKITHLCIIIKNICFSVTALFNLSKHIIHFLLLHYFTLLDSKS